MKMIPFASVLLLTSLFFFTSCRKKPIKDDAKVLIGSWERVTPSTLHSSSYDTEKITLVIKKNGSYKISAEGREDEKGRVECKPYHSTLYWDYAMEFHIRDLVKKSRLSGTCVADLRGNDSLLITQYQGDPYELVHVFVRR